jgi:hypothetical protein
MKSIKFFLFIGILIFSGKLFSQTEHNIYLKGAWSYTVSRDTFKLIFIDTIHCITSKNYGKLTYYTYKFSFNEKSNKGMIWMHIPGKQMDKNYMFSLRRKNMNEYKILERGYTETFYSQALLDRSDSTNTSNLKKVKD